MLHKCANPACPSLFRSLNLGKLFLLDTDSFVAGASGTSPVNRRGRSVRQVERYCYAMAVPHYSPSHLNVGGEWLQFRCRVGILPGLPCI